MSNLPRKKQESQKKSVADLYKSWNTLNNSEIELLLTSGQPNAPTIKKQTILSAGFSPLALYIAYLYTWCEDKFQIHQFTSQATGHTVYAAEEDATQNYALLRVGTDFMELTTPYANPSTIGILTLMRTLPDDVLHDIEDMLENSIVPVWSKAPEDWKLVGKVAFTLLQGFAGLLDKSFASNTKEVELYKTQNVSDIMLDISCKKSFGKLKNAASADEFESADETVAQRVLKLPPKADWATAMSAIHLMSPDEMLDDQILFIPSVNEPIFKERKYLTEWENDMINGVVMGSYRNIFLYGPAGTGKSTASRTLGLATGLPVYPPLVCSSNMQKSDLTIETIFNDQAMLENIESSLIKAVRYGGICEIQEPANVKDSGLLTCLNQILDPCGYISIPEKNIFFRRHPHCVVVMTSNLDYAGCKPPNQSVSDRFQCVRHIIALTAEELIKRVKTCPDVTMDHSFIEQMALAYIKVCELCVEESFYGEATYRTFKNWVVRTCECLDPIKAAEATVIDKVNISTDLESKELIRITISSILQKKKPIIKNPKVSVWAEQLAALATLVENQKK